METHTALTNKLNIAGVDFSNLNVDELTAQVNEYIGRQDKVQVCFVPTNSVMAAHHNDEVKSVYNKAALVICDGVPIRWASLFLGIPLKERITGFDFFPMFIEECIKKQYSVFFMGAAPGVVESLVEHYALVSPGLKISGYYCPPMATRFSNDENEKMIAMINNSKADVLFVSLTAPKQDIWIQEHLHQLNIKVAMGVGAAFNSVIGNIKRAPKWVQQAGLEWFYRFLQEPGRLFKRYFVEAPPFIPLVVKQYLQNKKQSNFRHAK
jgi:N-acetylglucosaminyldiphosphoundecaprenol N-acetyl-beta-D-mannosaminyltransferase